MPVVSQIVINDGKATPVAHTFSRMPSTASNIVSFRDALFTLPPAARAIINGSYRPAASNNDGAKRIWTLQIPKWDPTLKKVVGTARVKIETLIPDVFEPADLADVQAFLTNFTNVAEVKSEIKDQNPAS